MKWKGFLLSILTCCFFSSSFSQLNFHPPVYETIGAYIYNVEIADFNGDGLNDVIVGTKDNFNEAFSHKLFLYYQDSRGNLTTPLSYFYATSASRDEDISSMSIGDLNDDGRTDVLITTTTKVKLFYQKANGGLTFSREFNGGLGINTSSIGDLNNDGLVDFAISNRLEDTIRIFFQNSTTFRATILSKPKGSKRDQLQIADINNDGLNDLVYMRSISPGGIHTYLQDTSGRLALPIVYASSGANSSSHSGFDIGDIDNDGKNDMVATTGRNQPRAKINIWNQHDSDSMLRNDRVEVLNAYDVPQPVRITDLNCDGKNEIVTAHGGWPSISVFESDSAYQFSSYNLYSISASSIFNPYSLATGDINNDGLGDIVLANLYLGVTILYNNSTVPPDEYTARDTLISYDTLFVQKDSIGWDIDTISWEEDNFKYFQTDSTQLSYSFSQEEIVQSVFQIDFWSLCGRDYVDSTTYKNTSVKNLRSDISTAFISRTLDSILIADTNTNKPVIQNNPIRVYPNPNSGTFSIQLNEKYKNSGLRLSVHDNVGRIVLDENIPVGTLSYSVSLITANEVYFLQLSDGKNTVFAEKIIISH